MSDLPSLFSAIEGSRDELVAFLREMIAIPSENPPGNEAAMARFLAERLRALGFVTEVQAKDPQRPNVVARITGSQDLSRTILFNGHMDVFPVTYREGWRYDPWGGQLEGGRIYGRGTCDMKGGIAAFCWAAYILKESGWPLGGDVLLSAVSDENTGGPLGTQYLLERGLKAAMAVVAEPSHLDIVVACRGALWYEITSHGRAAHTGAPGINAIEKMLHVMRRVFQLHDRARAQRHPYAGAEEASPHVIRGGEVVNQIPALCSVQIDRRLVPGGTSLEEAEQELEALCREVAEAQQIKVTGRLLQRAEPAELSPEEPVVQLAQRLGEQVLGRRPELRGLFGFTDSRLLINQGKIPTIVLGPGELEVAHADDEYLEIEDLVRAAKLYAAMMAEVAGG